MVFPFIRTQCLCMCMPLLKSVCVFECITLDSNHLDMLICMVYLYIPLIFPYVSISASIVNMKCRICSVFVVCFVGKGFANIFHIKMKTKSDNNTTK